MKGKDEKSSRLILCVDLLSLLLSYFLAMIIRHGFDLSYLLSQIYGNTLFVLVLSYIVIYETSGCYINIFKRGFFEELVGIVKEQTKLYLILMLYLFLTQGGVAHSRIFLLVFFVLNLLITYVARSYMKLIMLVAYKRSSSSRKILLVTLSDRAADIIDNIRSEYYWDIYVTSIAILDRDMVGEKIRGLMVLANRDNLLEAVKLSVVDEVFIHLPYEYDLDIRETIVEFEKMGIVVHLNLNIYNNMKIKEKRVNNLGSYQVISFSTVMFEFKQVIFKRCIDIVGGVIGLMITGILTLFLAPAIKLESKGPVFFSQTRIGKNGRNFKIYKFRSMCNDAEALKKKLMDRNEMKGNMFKITDDPRITKVGKFIRKTSLDEFPQFLNVLKGDMSLVGTRPPTHDEFLQYEGRHKRRLSLKPGLTGLWQVSGRSNIEDFEEVVRLDLEYIDNWSMMLDVKLILKTMWVVVFGKGSK